MSITSRICPYCGKLNAQENSSCAYCQRRLPGELEHRARGALSGLAPYAATTLFTALSIAVYAGLVVGGGGQLFDGVRAPAALRWGALVGSLGLREPWRFLSAMFVHFNLMHVAFNALALHSMGRNVESSLGWARFTLLFLGSGVGGFVLSQLWYSPQPLTGGISGGIFGLLGAAIGWRYAQGDPRWKRDAISGVGYAVVMMLVPVLSANNAAHVGGLISGAALAWAFFRLGGERRPGRTLRGTAAVCVVATFASIALSLASPEVRLRGISLAFHSPENGP